jgi:hypothetical protein
MNVRQYACVWCLMSDITYSLTGHVHLPLTPVPEHLTQA